MTSLLGQRLAQNIQLLLTFMILKTISKSSKAYESRAKYCSQVKQGSLSLSWYRSVKVGVPWRHVLATGILSDAGRLHSMRRILRLHPLMDLPRYLIGRFALRINSQICQIAINWASSGQNLCDFVTTALVGQVRTTLAAARIRTDPIMQVFGRSVQPDASTRLLDQLLVFCPQDRTSPKCNHCWLRKGTDLRDCNLL